MKKREPVDMDRQLCPIVQAMSQIGDKWTLLLLRECYLGFRRFDQFQKNLGISKSVLTMKLKAMVENGLLEKKKYQVKDARARFEYHLTLKGRDFSKVIIALLEWGNRYLKDSTSPTLTIVEKHTQTPVQMTPMTPDGKSISWNDLKLMVKV